MHRHALAILSLLLVLFSASEIIAQEPVSPVPPDYSNWQYCHSGKLGKLCHGSNPLHSTESITEYFNPDTKEPRLLLWDVLERSKTEFNMHGDVRSYHVDKITTRMYVRENDTWKLVELREFSRITSPKNVRIPLFELDSMFGREYKKFLLEMDVAEESIKVPAWIFRDK